MLKKNTFPQKTGSSYLIIEIMELWMANESESNLSHCKIQIID